MKPVTIVAYAVEIVLVISSLCFASGYRGDIACTWDKAGIIISGKPETLRGSSGLYTVKIEKVYKGDVNLNETINFIDPQPCSSASLGIGPAGKYLIFLQTAEDRKLPESQVRNRGTTLVGIRVFPLDDNNIGEIEAAIDIVKKYRRLPEKDRKAFLLKHLPDKNDYYHSMIVREVLIFRITQAIPYFKEQLKSLQDETAKLDMLANLRCLGDPDVKQTLCDWLADESFKKKADIIEEMAKFNDKSLIPLIRRYVNDKDEYIAVTARGAILRLGDPSAKKLLLDMIQTSKSPLIRYNAIHTLNWNYSGDFTDDEKAVIQGLVNDKDQAVARVAGFMVEKWKKQTTTQNRQK